MEQNKNEKRLKIFLYVCIVVYVITLLCAIVINIMANDRSALGMSVVAIFTPLIVPICFKLLRFRAVYEIYIVSTVFVYFASLLGSGFHWYKYLGFDKVLHFSSGALFLTIAVILYFYLKKTNQVAAHERKIFIIFINAVNMAIALLWEFYEYAMLIFFNNDCINHYTQGVHDTITDMLCASVAGYLLTIFIARYLHNGKSNFFINVYEKFYLRNIYQAEQKKD